MGPESFFVTSAVSLLFTTNGGCTMKNNSLAILVVVIASSGLFGCAGAQHPKTVGAIEAKSKLDARLWEAKSDHSRPMRNHF